MFHQLQYDVRVFGASDDILTNCWSVFNRLSATISNQEDTLLFMPLNQCIDLEGLKLLDQPLSRAVRGCSEALYQERTTVDFYFTNYQGNTP